MEITKSSVAVVDGGGGELAESSFVRHMIENDHSHGQGQEALKDVVCGSVAGIVGKYIEYPFDTVKVRLQSQPDHLPLRYTGPLDCFKQSLKNDGFIGIYRGISAPLVGAAVETSCLFFSVSLLSTHPDHELWISAETKLVSPDPRRGARNHIPKACV